MTRALLDQRRAGAAEAHRRDARAEERQRLDRRLDDAERPGRQARWDVERHLASAGREVADVMEARRIVEAHAHVGRRLARVGHREPGARQRARAAEQTCGHGTIDAAQPHAHGERGRNAAQAQVLEVRRAERRRGRHERGPGDAHEAPPGRALRSSGSHPGPLGLRPQLARGRPRRKGEAMDGLAGPRVMGALSCQGRNRKTSGGPIRLSALLWSSAWRADKWTACARPSARPAPRLSGAIGPPGRPRPP